MADGRGTKGTVCKLLLHHKYDWVMIVVLVIIEIILNKVIHPFQRFIGKDMMTNIMYPRKSNTVPIWAVGVIAGMLPVIVFTCFFARRRNLYDLHHGILGLVFSLLITGVITDSVKNAVGRPRPDFFWRCFPDGIPLFDSKFGDVVCNGDRKIINEGHKSFPSGHTSWSFSGLAFLSLYLAAKMKAFDKRGHAGKVCVAFLPLLVAVLIGISRVDDYRHHWQDVFAGGLIGFVVSALCYMQYFPAPFGSEGLGPFAYLNNHGNVHESSCEISTELNVV